jgi:hypothetical protein
MRNKSNSHTIKIRSTMRTLDQAHIYLRKPLGRCRLIIGLLPTVEGSKFMAKTSDSVLNK